MMSDVEPELLEVVPWTQGYAHSWALRWMLERHPVARDQVLELLSPGGAPPWEVENARREFKVGKARVDLRVLARDAANRPATILVETRVNDALSEPQIRELLRVQR